MCVYVCNYIYVYIYATLYAHKRARKSHVCMYVCVYLMRTNSVPVAHTCMFVGIKSRVYVGIVSYVYGNYRVTCVW